MIGERGRRELVNHQIAESMIDEDEEGPGEIEIYYPAKAMHTEGVCTVNLILLKLIFTRMLIE